jgi:hypothetical protein
VCERKFAKGSIKKDECSEKKRIKYEDKGRKEE